MMDDYTSILEEALKECDRQPPVRDCLKGIGSEKIRSCADPDELLKCFPPDLQLHLDLCLGCRAGVLIVGMLIVATGGNVVWLEEEPPHE
jgi:hypothetical protein